MSRATGPRFLKFNYRCTRCRRKVSIHSMDASLNYDVCKACSRVVAFDPLVPAPPAAEPMPSLAGTLVGSLIRRLSR